MGYGYDDWEYPNWEDGSYLEFKKRQSGHVMAKKEAKVLRKIKVDTGLSEEEIRKIKKYRVMLSDTQKTKSADPFKHVFSRMRSHLRKLANEHNTHMFDLKIHELFLKDYIGRATWGMPYSMNSEQIAHKFLRKYQSKSK